MPIVLRPPSAPRANLRDRLRTIATTRKFARILIRASVGVVGIVVAVAVLIGADLLWQLSAEVRAVGLCAVAVGVVVLVLRGILGPLAKPTNVDSFAAFIEAEHPECNDQLRSAVAFLETTPDQPTLRPNILQQQVIDDAEQLSDDLELGKFVPVRRVVFATIVTVFACGIALGVAAYYHQRVMPALPRLFDPFGNHPWPSRTMIDILEPTRSVTRIARGEQFPIRFALSGVLPEVARIELKLASGLTGVEEILTSSRTELGTIEYRSEVEFATPEQWRSSPFEYRILANDAATAWSVVDVAEPPALVLFDGRPSPQVLLTPPDYTLETPLEISPDRGMIETVAGTTFRLRAAANRPLKSVSLRFAGDPNPATVAGAVLPFAGLTNAWPLMATLNQDPGYLTPHIGTIDANDPTRFALKLQPHQSGIYELRFEDQTGLAGTRLIDLRTFRDPPPLVTILQPTPSIEPRNVLLSTRIDLFARAADSLYAAKSLTLEYRVADSPWMPRQFGFGNNRSAIVGSLIGPGATIQRVKNLPLEAETSFTISSCTSALGKPPADGDTIRVRAVADDYDDTSFLKSPGTSAELVFIVRSVESFEAIIQKELVAARPKLAQALQDLQDAREQIETQKKIVPKPGEPKPDLREAIERAQLAEQTLQAQLSDPQQGIVPKLEQLRDQVRTNKQKPTMLSERLEGATQVLGELSRETLPNLDLALSRLKQNSLPGATPTSAEQKQSAEAVGQSQARAEELLKNTLEELNPWAATGELRGTARGLRDDAKSLAEEARELQKRLPAGVDRTKLPMADQAALERLGNDLARTADQTERLFNQAARVAEQKDQEANRASGAESSNSDPATAAAERDAIRKALDPKSVGQPAREIGNAADGIRNNRTAEAASNLEKAVDQLGKFEEKLDRNSAADVDELKKKRKNAAPAIEQLADAQDELAKKMDQLKRDTTQENREAARTELADQQAKLKDRAEELRRQLNRDGLPESAETLRRVQNQMGEIERQLREGRDPKKEADDAVDQLDRAVEQLQKPPEAEAKLDREPMEDVVAILKTVAERQVAAVAEAERLSAAAKTAKKWDRSLQASLAGLIEQERQLATEIRKLAPTLEGTKVVERMLNDAADEITQGTRRLQERKADVALADPDSYDAEAEREADAFTQRPLIRARDRLTQILTAIEEKPKSPAKPPEAGGEQPPPSPPMPANAQPPPQKKGLPPLVQLKLLRDWQTELTNRTAEFAKANPDPDNLDEDASAELELLTRSQQEITKLFAELREQFTPPTEGFP